MPVSLKKGQRVSLQKDGGAKLENIFIGLGWDITGGQDIDLDASCISYDESNKVVDLVWYKNKKNSNKSIVHSGDNTTGAGEGDDEVINFDLNNIPANVKKILVTVNSYSGEKFNQVENAFCRVVDKSNNKEMVKYVLSESKSHTGVFIAKIFRGMMGWQFEAIGEFQDGKTVKSMTDRGKEL